MLLDKSLLVSEDQGITATEVSEDSIDLQQARDLGVGGPLYGWVICTAIGTPGSGTCGFQVISGTGHTDGVIDAGIVVVATTPQTADDNITVGMHPVFIPFNPDPSGLWGTAQRYLGIRYNAGVNLPAGWKFTAGFTCAVDASVRIYPSGFAVL